MLEDQVTPHYDRFGVERRRVSQWHALRTTTAELEGISIQAIRVQASLCQYLHGMYAWINARIRCQYRLSGRITSLLTQYMMSSLYLEYVSGNLEAFDTRLDSS